MLQTQLFRFKKVQVTQICHDTECEKNTKGEPFDFKGVLECIRDANYEEGNF